MAASRSRTSAALTGTDGFRIGLTDGRLSDGHGNRNEYHNDGRTAIATSASARRANNSLREGQSFTPGKGMAVVGQRRIEHEGVRNTGGWMLNSHNGKGRYALERGETYIPVYGRVGPAPERQVEEEPRRRSGSGHSVAAPSSRGGGGGGNRNQGKGGGGGSGGKDGPGDPWLETVPTKPDEPFSTGVGDGATTPSLYENRGDWRETIGSTGGGGGAFDPSSNPFYRKFVMGDDGAVAPPAAGQGSTPDGYDGSFEYTGSSANGQQPSNNSWSWKTNRRFAASPTFQNTLDRVTSLMA